MSDVVISDEGYDILILEDRIKASEKPLESVKDEITEILVKRRALVQIRSELAVLFKKNAIFRRKLPLF